VTCDEYVQQVDRRGPREKYLLVGRFCWGFDATVGILTFEVYLRFEMGKAGEQAMEWLKFDKQYKQIY